MQLINLKLTRGDGPYHLAIPLTIFAIPLTIGGISDSATWLSGDGAGHTWRMQIRRSEFDSAPVLVTVQDITVQDVSGAMHVVITLWPADTALLRDGAVGDLELRRSGDRVNTIARLNIQVLEDVTR